VVVGAAAAAAGYLLGEREDEAGEPASTTATRTDPGIPAGWRLCSNERVGYAVAYPADWSAPALSAESECTFFDPEPIQLPESSDVFGATLEVAPAQETFAAVVESLVARRDVLERREVTLSGRPAVLVLSRANEPGVAPEGSEVAAYVVDRRAEPPLMLRTVNEPNSNWEERLRILDEAARTLVLFEPRRSGRSEETAPPDVVLRKRAAMLAAATEGDYDALAQLADPNEFEYTFGEQVDGGPAAYWRQAVARGEEPTPAAALESILQLPYTLSNGIYVWPFAYDKTEDELTSYERGLLRPLGSAGAFADGYLGWRAGIRPDGRWVFFVAGD
jgi:hypothetical protein